MASSLSSLSSIINQPQCALRIKFHRKYFAIGLGFLSHSKSHPCELRTLHCHISRPNQRELSLTFSRKLSQKRNQHHVSSVEGPSLRHFMPRASLVAADAQTEYKDTMFIGYYEGFGDCSVPENQFYDALLCFVWNT